MRLKELLTEAPLPDDWDSAIYNDRVPFKTRVEYAKSRAERVGRGSSRVAFAIPYQGRKTVLKIAMNTKGAGQNEAESELFSDYYLRNLGIVIPAIDWDETSRYPTWIHTEYADKMAPTMIKRFTGGGSLDDLLAYCAKKYGNRYYSGNPAAIDEELDFVIDFYDFYHNYNGIVHFGDFARSANWGMYKGKPVILDIGFTHEVNSKFYKR